MSLKRRDVTKRLLLGLLSSNDSVLIDLTYIPMRVDGCPLVLVIDGLGLLSPGISRCHEEGVRQCSGRGDVRHVQAVRPGRLYKTRSKIVNKPIKQTHKN